MAEKTNDMKQFDAADPVSAMSGAQIDRTEEDRSIYPASELERREMQTNLGEHPTETEHLKSQIEATRNQMGETIDAIQEKLSVENISNEVSTRVSDAIDSAKHTAYDATVGKAARFVRNTGDQISNSKAADVARENPIPLILLGVGAGWLAYSGFASRRQKGRTPSYRAATSLERRHHDRSSVADTYRESIAKASEVAGSAYEGVSDAASSAYSKASDLASRSYETAGEYAQTARDKYDHYIESSPLAVGALAFAAGAAIGFAFPSTRVEGEIMGSARDKVLDKAQNAAGEVIDRAKRLAEENRRPLKQSDSIIH